MLKKRNAAKHRLNPFVKVGMYILLFLIIPALFIDINVHFFSFRDAFMPAGLFLIFLFSKAYILSSCLSLTNKLYIKADIFFIVLFVGLYIISRHNRGYSALLFFTIYTTCLHVFYMVNDVIYEGITPLKEKILNPKLLFQKRMMNMVDVIKPIVKYSKEQFSGNSNEKCNNTPDIDIELVSDRFFNSIDNKEFPITKNEIIKIYHDLNINIFKQRRYSKSEFLGILITLDLVGSHSEYNSLRRHKCSRLKSYNLGGNLKKLLQAIAILKDIDCHLTCAKDIYDYWITTESSL